MTVTASSTTITLERVLGMGCSAWNFARPVLDKYGAEPLRNTVQNTWNALPYTNTDRVHNWTNRPSLLARTTVSGLGAAVVGGLGSAAVIGKVGLAAAASLPLTLTAAAVSGGVALRAAYLTRTGLNLPDDSMKPLREATASMIAFQKNSGLPVPNSHPSTEPTSVTPATNQVRIEIKEQTKHLVENFSIYATVNFIHGRFGLEASQDKINQIIKESKAPGGSLWTSYLKHLGGKLSLSQLVQACLWYFLTYKLGLIPNSINLFVTNLLKEVQAHIAGARTHLEPGVDKLLTQVGQFLDAYNQATKEYAELENPQVSIHEYRQERLRQLGGSSLENLCEETSKILVDEFFHDIPLFEALKQTPSLWILELLCRPFEKFVNWLGRKIIKQHLPIQLKAIVEKGIDFTSPQNLHFACVITKSLNTSLLEILNAEDPPPEILPSVEARKLPEVVDKLITALSSTGEKQNPLDTQEKIRAHLKSQQNNQSFWTNTLDSFTEGVKSAGLMGGISGAMALAGAASSPLTAAILGGTVGGILGTTRGTRPDKWARENAGKARELVENAVVKKIMVDSGKEAIGYAVNHAEKMIANLLKTGNEFFEQECDLINPEIYQERCEQLQQTAKSLFEKIIRRVGEGPTYKKQKDDFDRDYGEQTRNIIASVNDFASYARFISRTREHQELRTRLNQYMKAVETFIDSSPAKLVQERPDEMIEVKKAFFATFGDVYEGVSKLASKLVEVQKLQQETEFHEAKAARLLEILRELHRLHQNIEDPNALANFEQRVGKDCVNLVVSLKFSIARKSEDPVRLRGILRQQIDRYILRIQSEPRTPRNPGKGERPAQLQKIQDSNARLFQSIRELQAETDRVVRLKDAVKPARLEGNSFLTNYVGIPIVVSEGTKVGLRVFNQALQLATQHQGVYDGLARVAMGGLTKAYTGRG